MVDNPLNERSSANAWGSHQDQRLTGERWHLLHSLVQLKIGRIDLGILAEVIGKSLLLLFLKWMKMVTLAIIITQQTNETK